MRPDLFKTFAIAVVLGLAPAIVQAESLSGAYLAATQAESRNDHHASARFYLRALELDADNEVLLQNAIGALVADGDFAAAVPVARKMLDLQPGTQLAALVLLADAIREGRLQDVKAFLADESYGFHPLLLGLLSGWNETAIGQIAEAEKAFDGLKGSDALELFGKYHKALMYALAGDFQNAENLLATGNNGSPIELNVGVIDARIQILSQLERNDEALALAQQSIAEGYFTTRTKEMAAELQAGNSVPFDFVTSPTEGSADAFMELAAALIDEDADIFALIYARLASHVRPDFEAALILTAQILELQGQYDTATKVYAEVPADSHDHLAAEIGRANALRAADRANAGIEVLTSLARQYPDSMDIQIAVGDAKSGQKDYAGAEIAYSAAIAMIAEPQKPHWALYYSRAIALERQGKWDEAEKDFRQALVLYPDQPLVLNYLGYSLVEKGLDLAEAQGMIEKAVKQRPDDGYITDSLGWVLYRLGKFQEAVAPMERAVELLPVDPVLNDHLGDVFWMVDRKLEAEFQWRRALSFEPEEDVATRIRSKLELGLDAVLEAEAEADDAAEPTANGG